MKIKILLINLFLVLSLSLSMGCLDEKDPADSLQDSVFHPLSLSVQKSMNTKSSSDSYLNSGADIGLFVMDKNGGNYNKKDYSNYKYTASGEVPSQTWNTTQPIYLSSVIGKAVAYFPWSSTVKDHTAIPVKAGTTDYLYSRAVENISRTHPEVMLNLNHALACVQIKIEWGSYEGARSISEVTISSLSFATEGLLNAETGELYALSGLGSGVTLTADEKSSFSEGDEIYNFLVIPATDQKEILVKITLDGKEYSCVMDPAKAVLPQGGIFSLTVRVDRNQLSFTDLTIEGPGDLDEEGNLIIDLNGYKVRIGGNTNGLAFSYKIEDQKLTLYAVSLNQDKLVNAAHLFPVNGGTFTQTADETSKTITLTNLNQDVEIRFNGVRDKIIYVQYLLKTNQGRPDVYVDNVYKGRVNHGYLYWSDIEYNTAKEIRLENVTDYPEEYRYPQYYIGGYSQKSSRGTFGNSHNMYGKAGETIVYKNLREVRHWQIRGWLTNTSATLQPGQTEITVDYIHIQGQRGWDEEGDPFTSYQVTSNPYPDDWTFEWDAASHSLSVTYGTKSKSCQIQLRSANGFVNNAHFSRD